VRDRPGATYQAVKYARNENYGLENNADSPPASLAQRVAQMARLELRDASEPRNATSAGRLLVGGDATIIVGLLQKGNYKTDGEYVHSKVDPKGNRPVLRHGDEGTQQRAHVGADDDEGPEWC
jgi:hypothetical protein